MLDAREWPVVGDVLPTGSPVLLAAQMALTAGVRAAAKAHRSVPCLVEAEPLWLSSSSADHRRAVDLCLVCPVIATCRAVADAQPAPFGVWAGRVYSIKSPSRRGRRRRRRGQVVPQTAAQRLRALVTAADGMKQRSPQQRARNEALFRMSSAGWSCSALATATGLTRRTVNSLVSGERRRIRTSANVGRAA